MNMNSIKDVKSPCVGVCELDEKKKCTGCGRTEGEIKLWNNFNDYAKFMILERIAQTNKVYLYE